MEKKDTLYIYEFNEEGQNWHRNPYTSKENTNGYTTILKGVNKETIERFRILIDNDIYAPKLLTNQYLKNKASFFKEWMQILNISY